MRPIWLCMALLGGMLAFSLGTDTAWAVGRGGGYGGGHVGYGARYGARFGQRRFGLNARGFGAGRDGRYSGRRYGRGYGYGYGGFGGYGGSYGNGGGEIGGSRGGPDNAGYPVALGIRPAPTRAPTTYVVGRRDGGASRRGTMNRSGGGALVADSDQDGFSGVDATRPRVVRVP
jgi:hypothetical protein